ncbi:PKD domain-containing protein, partial [Xylanibacter rodentium]
SPSDGVIDRVEYFWDDDPGFGLATRYAVPDVTGSEALLSMDVLTEGLGRGLHMLGVRVGNTAGWSPTYRYMVAVSPSDGVIDRVEYFWDDDPGFGLATRYAVPDVIGSEAVLSMDVLTEGLGRGLHMLGVRVGNTAGWSPTYRYMVAVSPSDGVIDRVEYFWDEDPGFGLATRYAVPDVIGSEAVLSMDVLTEGLGRGLHMLGVRVGNTAGWSPTYRYMVAVSPSDGVIDRVEYFWDEDPGFGLATPLPFTGTDVAVVDTDIESYAGYGSHTLVVRARSGGVWGSPLIRTFCINAEPDFSLPADTVCRGEKFTVTNTTRGATEETVYSWDMDGDGKADATGADDFVYTYAKAGEYMVSLSVKTVGDCETTCTKPVVVLDTADPSVRLNASVSASCSGDTVMFTAKTFNAGGYPEYEWTVNGEVVRGATGDTLLTGTLSDRDRVQVTVLSSNPCSPVNTVTSPAITVTVNPSPEVSLAPLFPVYTTEDNFILSGGMPEGGIYYINGSEASVFAPKENASGSYTMSYRYANAHGCVSEAVQTFALREPGAGSLLLGDVNKDERVDIMDILCTVDHIFGRVFPTWNRLTADIDSDGRIDVTDIIGIAGIILGDDATGRAARQAAAGAADDVTLTAMDADAGNATEVYLNFALRGAGRPCGVQFDVTMPEGVELETATEGLVVGRKAGTAANTYTLLAYSSDLRPVGGQLSVRAVLPVNMDEGSYPVVPENVVMVAGDMRAIDHSIAPGRLTVGSPTAVRGLADGRPAIVVESDGLRVLNAGGGSLSVYDAGGRFVAASTIGGDNELVSIPVLVQGTYVAEINKDGRTVRTKFIRK